MPPTAVVEVAARAALAGNPSDIYGGAVLAVPVPSLRARVEIADASERLIVGDESGNRLVAAAMARLGAEAGEVRWTTDIPRTVGLAGSSALIVATLRAVLERQSETMTDLDLALLALAVEVDEFDILAGLQDRAVQAAGRPVLVDVAGDAPMVTLLEPARQLDILIAWLPDAAADSGAYHRGLAAALAPGHGEAMAELARLARAAATAFVAGDADVLADLMAASAATRARVAPLSAAHEMLADAIRGVGLVPNSAGSGGAVAAVVRDSSSVPAAKAALRGIGGQLLVESY